MSKILRVALLWLALPAVVALAGASEAPPAGEEEVLDRAVVEATRLRDLRAAVTRAQDEFLALYNKLNTDHRQRVACNDQAPTGSRLNRRQCSTRAQDEVTQEQAAGLLSSMEVSASIGAEETRRRTEELDTLARRAESGQATPEDAGRMAELQQQAQTAQQQGQWTRDSTANRQEQESDRFNKNLSDLLEKHPELRERADAYLEARRRLEAASQRR